MNKEQLLGIIRHILTAVGVVLVYKGLLDDGTVLTIIGAITSAASGIWSLFDKTNAKMIEKAEIAKINQLINK